VTSTSLSVGELVTAHPRAVAVLQRRQIDFCCGGARPLAEACAARGIDPQALLEEVHAEEVRWRADAVRWDERSLPELIDHILTRYHEPLITELPRILAMAHRVQQVHGDKDPRIAELVARVIALKDDLLPHMQKEELVLFPLIRGGRGMLAGGPITVMHVEHEEVGALLRQIRALTDDFTAPDGACGTWRALWQGLADLEADLHEHIHLENNILFPKALHDGADAA
jgi:regulator of cell morphogenesis and NO signaling